MPGHAKGPLKVSRCLTGVYAEKPPLTFAPFLLAALLKEQAGSLWCERAAVPFSRSPWTAVCWKVLAEPLTRPSGREEEEHEIREEIGRGTLLVSLRGGFCVNLCRYFQEEWWVLNQCTFGGGLYLRDLFIFPVEKVKPQITRCCELFPQMENYQIFHLFWKYHLLALEINLHCWEGKKGVCEVNMPGIVLSAQRECQEFHALWAMPSSVRFCSGCSTEAHLLCARRSPRVVGSRLATASSFLKLLVSGFACSTQRCCMGRTLKTGTWSLGRKSVTVYSVTVSVQFVLYRVGFFKPCLMIEHCLFFFFFCHS